MEPSKTVYGKTGAVVCKIAATPRRRAVPHHSLHHSNKVRISKMALVATPVSSSKVLD